MFLVLKYNIWDEKKRISDREATCSLVCIWVVGSDLAQSISGETHIDKW